MKKIIKGWVLIVIFCMSMGTIYATNTETLMTEKAFINELLKVNKTGSVSLTVSEETLTREKAATLIVKYLGYEAIAKKQNNLFNDVTSSQGEISLVSQLGLMSGLGNGLFQPNGKVTVSQGDIIINRIKNKLEAPITWKHAFYAIQSSSQKDWIKGYNAISFGWAQLERDENNSFIISTNNTENDFKVPAGFEGPMDFAKANGVETYLMVYFENKGMLAKSFLENELQRASVINQLVSLSQGMTKDGVTRAFDGVTIDFEQFLSSDLKAPYNTFIKELKSALQKEGKKLNVALQPTLYFKGYDYKGIGEIADHIILMAHDYGATTLTEVERQIGVTTTPLTPIKEVYDALYEAVTNIVDKSKIVLQFSFASLQWQSQNNQVVNTRAYTPTYDKIEARLSLSGTTKHFDSYLQSTYATYEENGIQNIIWYEDINSIQSKIDLAKLMGVTSVSYWRLGIIPEAFNPLK